MVVKPIIFLSKPGKGVLPLTASQPSVSEYQALYYSSFSVLADRAEFRYQREE